MHQRTPLSRREFLKRLLLTAGSITLASCTQADPPSSTAAPVLPTNTPFRPSPPATYTPAATPTSAPSTTPYLGVPVSIARADSYDAAVLRRALEGMLDQTGFSQVVRPGSRVAIKANLTGGAFYDSPDKPLAVDTYVTHPAVAGAIGELCRDAGAKSIDFVDGLGDEKNWQAWGYEEMAERIDARLVDLCKPDPYPDFVSYPVGTGFLVYEVFHLNPVFTEVDVVISIAKMKMHHTTGVTLSLKNMVGITPIVHYRRYATENNRSALHEEINGFDSRMPRVIVDLNCACPVRFAVIDGVRTCEGGAGPWDANLNPVKPGLLFAGPDPVAVDAVTASAMGVDPQGETGEPPYIHGENHLTLAREAGLGTNRLDEITVLGERIEDVRMAFEPVP